MSEVVEDSQIKAVFVGISAERGQDLIMRYQTGVEEVAGTFTVALADYGSDWQDQAAAVGVAWETARRAAELEGLQIGLN